MEICGKIHNKTCATGPGRPGMVWVGTQGDIPTNQNFEIWCGKSSRELPVNIPLSLFLFQWYTSQGLVQLHVIICQSPSCSPRLPPISPIFPISPFSSGNLTGNSRCHVDRDVLDLVNY